MKPALVVAAAIGAVVAWFDWVVRAEQINGVDRWAS